MTEKTPNQQLTDAANLANNAMSLAIDTGVATRNGEYGGMRVAKTDGSELAEFGTGDSHTFYAIKTETTGDYSTPYVSTFHQGKKSGDKVTFAILGGTEDVNVERSDGNGNVYRGTLRGDNAERAAAIVVSRTARDIGTTATVKAVATAEKAKRMNF